MSEQLNLWIKSMFHTYVRNYVNFKKCKCNTFDEDNKDYIDFTSELFCRWSSNKKSLQTNYEQILNITHISNLYGIEPISKIG